MNDLFKKLAERWQGKGKREVVVKDHGHGNYSAELEEIAYKSVENFGAPQQAYTEHGQIIKDGKWTAIGKAYCKWFLRE